MIVMMMTMMKTIKSFILINPIFQNKDTMMTINDCNDDDSDQPSLI